MMRYHSQESQKKGEADSRAKGLGPMGGGNKKVIEQSFKSKVNNKGDLDEIEIEIVDEDQQQMEMIIQFMHDQKKLDAKVDKEDESESESENHKSKEDIQRVKTDEVPSNKRKKTDPKNRYNDGGHN